jgi:hypothetical protein
MVDRIIAQAKPVYDGIRADIGNEIVDALTNELEKAK